MRGKQIRHLVALMVTFAFCTGCGGSSNEVSPLPGDAVILAFGDSLTHGTGALPEEAYPSVLARRTGYRVVNAGVPGEVTGRGLKRLPRLLGDIRPDLVVLCHGGNDLLQGVPREEIRANLEAMIGLIQARGAQVILLGVPGPGLFLKADPLYRKAARSRDVVYEPYIIVEVLSSSPLKGDQIHPNARGYERIAEAVMSLIPAGGAAGASNEFRQAASDGFRH